MYLWYFSSMIKVYRYHLENCICVSFWLLLVSHAYAWMWLGFQGKERKAVKYDCRKITSDAYTLYSLCTPYEDIRLHCKNLNAGWDLSLATGAQWSFWRSERTKRLAIIRHAPVYSGWARMTNLISIFFVNRSFFEIFPFLTIFEGKKRITWADVRELQWHPHGWIPHQILLHLIGRTMGKF